VDRRTASKEASEREREHHFNPDQSKTKDLTNKDNQYTQPTSLNSTKAKENPFRPVTPIHPGRDLECSFLLVKSISKIRAVPYYWSRAVIYRIELPGPCRPTQNDWDPLLRTLHLTASQLPFDLVPGFNMLVLGLALRLAVLCIQSRPNAVSFASAFTTITPRYQSISHSSQAANPLATMNPTPIRFAFDSDRTNSLFMIAVLVPDYTSISLSGSCLTNSMTAWQPTSREHIVFS
jgi:hypothetical protein